MVKRQSVIEVIKCQLTAIHKYLKMEINLSKFCIFGIFTIHFIDLRLRTYFKDLKYLLRVRMAQRVTTYIFMCFPGLY